MRVRGFRAPVFHAEPRRVGSLTAGVGLGVEVVGGEPTTVLTLHHEDGTMLSARLDDASLERLAEALAIVIEHGNTVLLNAGNDR